MANRLAELPVEGRHGLDGNPIRGRGERGRAGGTTVRIGQESSAMKPGSTGKVMALISGRSGGGECRTFRLESEDMFVNPFAGPWNDEAVLVRFRQDLASHPEKLEEILAAYVRQDPALAPRLLALALARRPIAAIKLASVAASAGSLGRIGVLSILLAATATMFFGSADQADAAEARLAHPSDANSLVGSSLMPASAFGALLVGASNALAASSAVLSANADGAASLHAGSAAHDDGALEARSATGAKMATAGAAGASYGDRANADGNNETIGSGHSAANPISGRAATQENAQAPDPTHGHAQSIAQEGANGTLRGVDGSHHWVHAAYSAADGNPQPGILSSCAEDHNAGATSGVDRISSEKSGGSYAHEVDGAPILGGNAQNANVFGDAWLGFEKSGSAIQGAGTEAISSFLSPGGAFSCPTAGGAECGSLGGFGKGSVNAQQLGQDDTSSLLGVGEFTHGIRQTAVGDAHDQASGDGVGLPNFQTFTGAGSQHDLGGLSFLSSSSSTTPGLDGLASALKETGSVLVSPLGNPTAPGNSFSMPTVHEATFLSSNGAAASEGFSGHATGVASANGGAAQFGSIASLLQGFENGGSGAGSGAASLGQLLTGGKVALPFGSPAFSHGIVDGLHSVDAFSAQAGATGGAQGVVAAAGSNHASSWMASGLGHNLADAFSWQGGSSGGDHGGAPSAFADWTHIGSGHSG